MVKFVALTDVSTGGKLIWDARASTTNNVLRVNIVVATNAWMLPTAQDFNAMATGTVLWARFVVVLYVSAGMIMSVIQGVHAQMINNVLLMKVAVVLLEVWSELFAWRNAPWADERCKIWHQKEPNPGEFKGTFHYFLTIKYE